MKKILFPLLCCMVAAWSCNLDGSYSAKNVQDIVTVATDHQLVSDTGVKYYVTEVAKDAPALEEGKRYYIIFDILNINYDISIYTVMPVQIVTAEEEDENEDITAHDPIQVVFNWIGRSYVDLGFSYYCDETSNCAHDVFARYTLTNGGSHLKISLYHDGNDENPASMDPKLLKKEDRIISIPISQWDLSSVTLSLDILSTDRDGNYVVERKEYSSQ